MKSGPRAKPTEQGGQISGPGCRGNLKQQQMEERVESRVSHPSCLDRHGRRGHMPDDVAAEVRLQGQGQLDGLKAA